MRRTIFTSEHDDFRESVRAFIAKEAVPHTEEWERAGMVDRSFWRAAASNGFVGFEVPEAYGGLGLRDFRFNAILDEEMAYALAVGDNFTLQNDIIAPYIIQLGTDEQHQRWLPRFTAGDLVMSIAMSEPGIGSDLRGMTTTARRTADGYVLNGAKTFISSGIQADLVIVAARAADDAGRSRFTLLAVEPEREGFSRGRKLLKVGRRAQDTAELFFDDLEVSAENVLGEEGRGLDHLKEHLAQERISMAVSGLACSEAALALTVEYCRERMVFGKPVGVHQANRFAFGEMRSSLDAARAYVDRCIEAHVAGELTPAEAASVKLFATELQCQVVDRCLQLHGGYGYMEEYPIARLWRDSRVQRIHGGTSEIMKDIIGRSMGF
jgi:alkylation response protein AidB-like acyl-CoA dehydrogenase